MGIKQLKQELVSLVENKLSEILREESQLLESFDSEDIKIVDEFIENTIQKTVENELNTLIKLSESEDNVEDDIDSFKPLIVNTTVTGILSGIDTIRSLIESILVDEQSVDDPTAYEVVIEACKRRKKTKKSSRE